MKRTTPTKAPTFLTAVALASALAACSATSDDESPTAATATSSPAPTKEAPADDTAAPTPDVTASADETEANPSGTPITITVDDQTFAATLNDSEVSQDLIEMLPVNLDWYRNYDIEYITELDAPLTETGPFYTDVQPGDLVYYNPMDSLTIIYEETSSVPTLTKMGEITSDLTAFRDLPDNVEMRIELG
jgi:hypothetical protein